jgi:ATP-dependent helicase/nuclease subunit A
MPGSAHKLIIYKASAGSGKTYKLTEEYLRLAFRVPFHTILAVTFTNKASSEMKERITGVLDLLARGKKTPYLGVLAADTGLDEASIRHKAGMLLNEILQNYSRFSVGTIDSFFQKVIRGFARETGLQSGFELELDNRRVLEKVIDRLMIETSTNSSLRNWMIRYADDRIREGHSWNFRQDIMRLGTQVFNETFLAFRKELTEKLSDRDFMAGYMASLQAIRHDFEEGMNGIGLAGLEFIRGRGLAVEDFSYGQAGVAGYFEKILAVRKQYEPGSRVLDAAADPGRWCTKKSPRKAEIEEAVGGGLTGILARALDLYTGSWPLYASSRLVLSNLYTLGILNDITRSIREYASTSNLFLLSDVASLLAGITGSNDAPFIYEKTGHFYRHFMIDEFQDTSTIQWKNFVPLITNSLAENNRNILVGDVKQSIYRWRNGDWKILATGLQEEMKVFMPGVKTLEVNWRSRQNIVHFNNHFFDYGPEIIQRQFHGEYLQAGLPEETASSLEEQISSAYAGQAQKLPEGSDKEGGFVSVAFRENDDRNWKQDMLDELPAILTGIISRGYRPGDIAILVRNRVDGNQVAAALMDWQAGEGREAGLRLDFISEEFLLLQESSAVRLLLAVLGYMVDPSDRLNIGVILNEYCRHLQCYPGDPVNDIDLFGSINATKGPGYEAFLPARFISRKEYLSKLSLYELVEELTAIFKLEGRASEIPYLMAFQDVVLDYSRKEGGGTVAFLDWWKEHCGSQAVSSNERQDALRIMTIHKAKGLQFRVVLIPFADWSIDHNPTHDNFLWCRPALKPFSRLDLVPVKYKSELAGSIFALDYFNEKMQVFVDNLNLLYVAFTRAEDELYAFTPLPGEKQRDSEQVKSVSALLYRILSAGRPPEETPAGGGAGTEGHLIDAASSDADHAIPGGRWNNHDNLFTIGERQIVSRTPGYSSAGDLVPGIYHVNDFRDRLQLRLRGNLLGDKGIDHGRLMHGIFENIITLDDTESAVMQKQREGVIGKDEAGQLIAEIKRMTGAPGVAGWFDGSWKVRNEATILHRGGKTRRPDRVMIKEKQVIVVDYKFGENVQPRYRNQVRRYMDDLAGMGYESLKGFVWYPLSGILDEVTSISQELEFE